MSNIINREVKSAVDKLNNGEMNEGLKQVFNIGVLEGKTMLLKTLELGDKKTFLSLMEAIRKVDNDEYMLICKMLKERGEEE